MKVWMKFAALIFFGLFLSAFPVRVWAQEGSAENSGPTIVPTAGPTTSPADIPQGVVTGKIINKNDPSKPFGDLEVMLHVLDQDQNQLGMLHGKSGQDGSFTITDVPFQMGLGYAAAVVYEGTTYYSQFVPAVEGETSANLDVPVYESTTDLSTVQVTQMHVLFSFAQDGMEVKELYMLSNLGDRTVKDGVEVPGNNGVKAAVRFPLPEKADFINFQPQNDGRFLKYPGGFADRAPIVPGQMVTQLMVEYLMPYTTPLTYPLKTVLPIQRVNFVVPQESGVTLKGAGLGEPESVTAQDGQRYDVYKLENTLAGKTLDLSFEGDLVIPNSQIVAADSPTNLPNQIPLFMGLGIFGVALIGMGAFWWLRSSKPSAKDDFEDKDLEGQVAEDGQPALDALLQQIVALDMVFDQGELDEATYLAQRNELKTQVRAMLVEPEATSAEGEPVPSE